MKRGDGINPWNSLPYIGGGDITINPEDIQDIIGNDFLVSGSGINISYDDSLNSLTISTSGVSFVGHVHIASDITDFNSSVSGLLPTIDNSGDNRLLTSTGTNTGINAENNITFDGNQLNVIGSISVDNLNFDNNTISSSSGNIIISPNENGALQRDSDGDIRGEYAVDWQGARDLSTQVASGNRSTIGGGKSNTASGNYSTVGGGVSNTASSYNSTVGGGVSNTASSYNSTVGGGTNNTASSYNSTVGGGANNTSSGYYSTVGGGRSNTASNNSTVGGGENNTSSGNFSVISGGSNNNASSDYTTISGGTNNNANTSSFATIGGGYNNTSSGSASTVSGGLNNISSNGSSTVGGGKYNTSSGESSTVGGGWLNVSQSWSCTVAGGRNNTSSNRYATVCGGRNNTASGYGSVIVGGVAAKAFRHGEISHAANSFANPGDSQHMILIGRKVTTNATPIIMLLNGGSLSITGDGVDITDPNIQMIVPSQTSWNFSIKINAYNSTDNQAAWWNIRGGIRRNASNGTSLIGTLITENGSESSLSSASVSVGANDTKEALEIIVTGVTGKTIRWVAVVDINQVSFGTT